MKKNVGGLMTPLPTYVLTFDRLKLPNVIRAAWLRIEVRPYIPSCRRCFYCQRYGHVSNTCRRKMKGEKSICETCGQEEYGVCSNIPCCINCGEAHSASSKKCNRFLFEKEVQALRAKEPISFKEARQKINAMFVRPGITYSSLLAKGSQKRNIPASANTNGNRERTLSYANLSNKRRLSGEKEESSSSKIHLSNNFSLLQDEMDYSNFNSSNHSIQKVISPISASSSDQMGPSVPSTTMDGVGSLVSVCSLAQAGSSVLACASDQAEASVRVCTLVQCEASELAYSPSKIGKLAIPVQNLSHPTNDAKIRVQNCHSAPVSTLDSSNPSEPKSLEMIRNHDNVNEEILPSLEAVSVITKVISTNKDANKGAVPKTTPKTDAKPQNISRWLKIPQKNNKMPNKNKKDDSGKHKISSHSS